MANFEARGTWAFRDTAAHEGFHAFLARRAGVIWAMEDARLGRIPIGAPIKYAEEVVAFLVGLVRHFAFMPFRSLQSRRLEA